MNETDARYYSKYAIAAIRGNIKRLGKASLIRAQLLEKEIDELSGEEGEELFDFARENEIKLYHFKRSDRLLPRVNKVLGFLKGIYFESLLDVGSGRGVFLLPFMEEFPNVPIKSIDILDKRVNMLSDIRNGGIPRLEVYKASICDAPFPKKSVDVVTMLEVLEHIPDVGAAIRAAVDTARKYVVVTVPSKEDDNPEHIHLLTKERLTAYFKACGADRLSFDGVTGHLFMIAKLGE